MKVELYPIFRKNDLKNELRSAYLVTSKKGKGEKESVLRRVLRDTQWIFIHVA